MNRQADFIAERFTLGDLTKAIKDKYGEACNLDEISIEADYRQYKCFGYDLYDSDDYRIEFDFSK